MPSVQDLNSRRNPKNNAATGASAAGARAIGSQAVAFYFRAPAFARAINPRVQAQESWSLRMSTPALLAHAVKTYGWGFIPNHVLPPMLANISVGAILYTSYLQILGTLHPPSSQSLKRVYPPPPLSATFRAGAAAGAIQSVIAAPLDALSVRFRTSDILNNRYRNMWEYGAQKTREIGMRGVFAGWGLNCIKDSLGTGLFFTTFEFVKAQAYYRFIAMYYGDLRGDLFSPILKPKLDESGPVDLIKPHYAIEPTFLAFAGITAAVAQQTVSHPLGRVQDVYYRSIEAVDREAKMSKHSHEMVQSHIRRYQKTFEICAPRVRKAGSWRKWLFRGFWWNTIKQVPSTAAGLIIFELVRKRYGFASEAVKIEEDGYDILLT
ncbi:uncharacterized protein KY384_000317 [Bacidia gigantensis]|uniref:uncharacterized protein n=1 Tax=Bacidia gigantensis TaxID=2732470 RepID=UPI001D059F74|nr:uncharacterized protein KY384_000317 [Bacidia gigantensis]KAG8526324.1 hypothetical protein KY384_000317 [Bacidia gigantensis]